MPTGVRGHITPLVCWLANQSVLKLSPDALTLLNDEAVYRRTPAGQRELTDRHGDLSKLERRFLSAVTGHTPLRVLLDLGLDDPGIVGVIISLATRGLIRLEQSR
jgi:hypothetical protein